MTLRNDTTIDPAVKTETIVESFIKECEDSDEVQIDKIRRAICFYEGFP